ncbi:hypothetical protein FEK35_27335 [Nocardia cyriacigeorgica]|uniref:Secreted protein n=1 Tax=Nocardia cyriacigeorgica TaxID=135487 RepID=A0A5R8P6A1_9NOCA|nr:hypothetical protein [Nocardia cyriacigeorgica]TLF96808.1 hypothetical protein FEK35_27335 [Nocardia cyriacigeorgica]
MRLPSILAVAAIGSALASPIAGAFPFDTGSASPAAPVGPTVQYGDYCGGTTAPDVTVGHTADGQPAHCVRVLHTDAYVWSPTPDPLPVDPHFPVRPGDDCLDEGARWVDSEGRAIICQPTVNGRNAGNLVWMLDH